MRLCRTSALASALLTLAAVAEARAGEPEAEPTATSSAAEDGLVRRERPEEGPGLEVGRLALRFPGALIELAFTPLLPVAVAMDKYHLLDRVIDLLTNDDKTIAFVPVVDPFNSSGLGLGGSLIYNEPLGSADRRPICPGEACGAFPLQYLSAHCPGPIRLCRQAQRARQHRLHRAGPG